MSEVSCPSCGAKLFPNELRDGQCTSCMASLPSHLQADPPAATSRPAFSTDWPEDRGEYPDYKSRRTDVRRAGGGWGVVRVGLGLVGTSVVIILIAQLGSIVLTFAAGGPRFGGGGAVLGLGLNLIMFAAGLMGLIGMCLGIAVPGETGLKGLIIGCVSCIALYIGMVVAAVVLGVAGAFNNRGGMPEAVVFVPLCGAVIALFTGHLLFFLFLRGVANYFGNRALGAECITFFIVGIVLVVAAIGFVFLAGFGRFGGGMGDAGLTLALGCGMLLFSLVMMIWLISLLFRVRDAIPTTRY